MSALARLDQRGAPIVLELRDGDAPLWVRCRRITSADLVALGQPALVAAPIQRDRDGEPPPDELPEQKVDALAEDVARTQALLADPIQRSALIETIRWREALCLATVEAISEDGERWISQRLARDGVCDVRQGRLTIAALGTRLVHQISAGVLAQMEADAGGVGRFRRHAAR